MEDIQSTSLFGLGIDPNAKSHLSEAGRWAKFLAIVGFVTCALAVMAAIFSGSVLADFSKGGGEGRANNIAATGFASFFVFVYLSMAVICFFPCLFLFRFATRIKKALAASDQETLNSSFQNLKIMFRYIGIFAIIIIAFYAVVLIFALLGAGLSRV